MAAKASLMLDDVVLEARGCVFSLFPQLLEQDLAHQRPPSMWMEQNC